MWNNRIVTDSQAPQFHTASDEIKIKSDQDLEIRILEWRYWNGILEWGSQNEAKTPSYMYNPREGPTHITSIEYKVQTANLLASTVTCGHQKLPAS